MSAIGSVISSPARWFSPLSEPRPQWLISRRIDLLFIIGSALAGYVYLGLYAGAAVPITLLWWFWSVGFDGTHIFGMASRTYFDNEAMRRQGRMLIAGALFFFSLGPALIALGGKRVLVLLLGTWAYYHVVRQHYGFMVLYKVKNRDLAPEDNRIDRNFLAVMLAAPPIFRYVVFHPEELRLPPRFALAQIAPALPWILAAACGLVAAVWTARQVIKWRTDGSLNPPKLLLLGAVIPLHWLTFYWMNVQAAIPTVTIVHNIQYHALIWWHNRNRYADSAAGHGRVPRAVSRSLLTYAAAAILFSVLYRVPGFSLSRISDLAFGFFCGFGMTHYWLDSKIWRVREDPELRTALRLN
jgi:hypothetical protein